MVGVLKFLLISPVIIIGFSKLTKQASVALTTMAWTCSASTNAVLIKNMQEQGIITNPQIARAMSGVNRGNYVENLPFEDGPQDIGGNQTISAPHMHAYAMEQLFEQATRENAKILDVGCGSGILCAYFGKLNPTARVVGIDIVPRLVQMTNRNLAKKEKKMMTRAGSGPDTPGVVIPNATNGWLGWPDEAPYDAIHVVRNLFSNSSKNRPTLTTNIIFTYLTVSSKPPGCSSRSSSKGTAEAAQGRRASCCACGL